MIQYREQRMRQIVTWPKFDYFLFIFSISCGWHCFFWYNENVYENEIPIYKNGEHVMLWTWKSVVLSSLINYQLHFFFTKTALMLLQFRASRSASRQKHEYKPFLRFYTTADLIHWFNLLFSWNSGQTSCVRSKTIPNINILYTRICIVLEKIEQWIVGRKWSDMNL